MNLNREMNFLPKLPIDSSGLLKSVESAVPKVIESLADFLTQNSRLLGQDEGSQLMWLEDNLNRMRLSLEEADSKAASSETAKIWVSELRDIACYAEDVIDNFKTQKAGQRKRRRLLSAHDDICATLHNEIETIKKKLEDLHQNWLNFGIGNLGDHGEEGSSRAASLQQRRRTSPLLQDSEVVGMEKDLQRLVELMTEGDSHLRVVSIVGMAGVGKTTLARRVYNNETVKNHFECCAWICVSKGRECRDLLLGILKSENIFQGILRDFRNMDASDLKDSLKKMDDVRLKEVLFKHLERKRYLLVLDDIWDRTAWDSLKSAFPDANFQSRILLTSRHSDVVSSRIIFHKLKCLGEKESWKLFCMRTFPEQDMQCPRNLEQIGKEIVAKCRGLPLTIVLIGRLLSRKEKRENEWRKMPRNISSQFVEGNPQIEEILALSYEDLPSKLKPCFLYFGSFPEDHEIYAEKLIRLWIAEGFIEESPYTTTEKVAVDYLDELMERSLVQVARRSCTGRVRSYRMHDLLRDFCVSKARERIFLHVIGNSARPSKVRRLAFHPGVHRYFSLDASTREIRSLSCNTTAREGLNKNQERLLFSGFKLLRVLDFYGLPLRELPDDISTLTLLRYLGCRRTDLESLPSSMVRLVNLETLDVTSSEIVKIPHVVWEMPQLKHFRVKGIFTDCDKPPPESEFPTNLQTLTHVKAGNWMIWLGKLPYLIELGIWGDDLPQYSTEFSNAVPKLEKLRYLKLGEWDDCSIPVLPPLKRHQNLGKLYLHGKLEKLPKSREFPPNLIKLTLRMTRLEHDPMRRLQKLNNLRILKLLDKAYSGKQMVCSAQGFRQLESLLVVYLNKLEEWRVEQGAMPSLQHLGMKYCMKLRAPPEGLQNRASLRLERFPPEESDNEDGGPDLR